MTVAVVRASLWAHWHERGGALNLENSTFQHCNHDTDGLWAFMDTCRLGLELTPSDKIRTALDFSISALLSCCLFTHNNAKRVVLLYRVYLLQRSLLFGGCFLFDSFLSSGFGGTLYQPRLRRILQYQIWESVLSWYSLSAYQISLFIIFNARWMRVWETTCYSDLVGQCHWLGKEASGSAGRYGDGGVNVVSCCVAIG